MGCIHPYGLHMPHDATPACGCPTLYACDARAEVSRLPGKAMTLKSTSMYEPIKVVLNNTGEKR